MVLASSVLLAGALLALGAYFGLRARASRPELAAVAAAPTMMAATATPTGSVAMEPAGTAAVSAQPMVPAPRATLSAASAPSAAPHAKPASTVPVKAQAKPSDDVDDRFKEPRR